MVLIITKAQLNMLMKWQNIRDLLQKKITNHETQKNK